MNVFKICVKSTLYSYFGGSAADFPAWLSFINFKLVKGRICLYGEKLRSQPKRRPEEEKRVSRQLSWLRGSITEERAQIEAKKRPGALSERVWSQVNLRRDENNLALGGERSPIQGAPTFTHGPLDAWLQPGGKLSFAVAFSMNVKTWDLNLITHDYSFLFNGDTFGTLLHVHVYFSWIIRTFGDTSGTPRF